MAEQQERTIVRQVTNATLYSDGTIFIRGVRASYPHVLTPKQGTDAAGNPTGEPAYSVTVLLPKTTHKEAKDLCKAEIERLMKEAKVPNIAAERKFLRDGNMSGRDDYNGHFTVSAREVNRPFVLDKDRRKMKIGDSDAEGNPDDKKIYGGCVCNVLIRPWWMNNKHGKRVNAGLSGIQFVDDGPAFGEGRLNADAIDETFPDESSGAGYDNDLANEAADL